MIEINLGLYYLFFLSHFQNRLIDESKDKKNKKKNRITQVLFFWLFYVMYLII